MTIRGLTPVTQIVRCSFPFYVAARDYAYETSNALSPKHLGGTLSSRDDQASTASRFFNCHFPEAPTPTALGRRNFPLPLPRSAPVKLTILFSLHFFCRGKLRKSRPGSADVLSSEKTAFSLPPFFFRLTSPPLPFLPKSEESVDNPIQTLM